jgi:hypothetical protein
VTPKGATKILNNLRKTYNIPQNNNVRLLSSKFASEQFIKTLDQACSTKGKKVWIEKTPQHILYIDYIKGLTKGIKFIHIERKPESVISSLYHASIKHPYVWPYNSKEKCFELWKESYIANQKCRDLDGHFFMTLNELIQEPSNQLLEIYDFLDINNIIDLENKKRVKFRTINEESKEWLFESQKPLLKKERCRFKEVFDIEERDYLSQKIHETINQANVV